MSKQRVKITRTVAEFVFINDKIKLLGKKNFNYFLRCEIRKLTKKYFEDPESITKADGNEKVHKVHYVDEADYNVLVELSWKMKKPVSAIIDDFFITPLLLPDKPSTL